MTAREFLTNAAILSTIMAVAALIEAAVPMFGRHSSLSPGLRTKLPAQTALAVV